VLSRDDAVAAAARGLHHEKGQDAEQDAGGAGQEAGGAPAVMRAHRAPRM
jgi:hypothetical protein